MEDRESVDRTCAVRVQPAWDDPAAVLELIRSSGPYLPLARYAATGAAKKATGGGGGSFVPPWFRIDVAALGRVEVDGGEVLLGNERFVDAARQVFGGDPVIEPTTLYVNVMGPCAYPFVAHTDIPVFRGRNAKNTPPWLLHTMHTSGLFAEERINLATAVSWFFDGPGGDFHYWPDGPAGESVVERSPFDNVAIVADNEYTHHGVGPVGSQGAPSPVDLTLDAELHRVDGRWVVVDGEREVISYDDDTVRITTSWKCEVYADTDEHAMVRSGDADLSIEEVVARFGEALGVSPPEDPLEDEGWIETLGAAYPKPVVRIPQDE